MKLFRNLLFWIVLALLGALVAQVLVQDPGYVLVRFRGMDYTTTLAVVVLVGAGVLVALWLLWKLVTVPVLGLRRRRRKAARARLYEGLEAYELGHWDRAAERLDEAARSPVVADDGSARLAHLAGARAAMA
ncbi:heme biosynthesis HemY N-terminal domain-containing protein, partial [Novilysobacter defluvii]